MTTQQITINVPEARVAEFYIMFGSWLGPSQVEPRAGGSNIDPPGDLQPFGEASADTAATWWNLLTPAARAMFGFLSDHPNSGYTGEELAMQLNVKGPAEVAGITSWPGVRARELGLTRPWRWDSDSEAYSVDDAMAAVIKSADIDDPRIDAPATSPERS